MKKYYGNHLGIVIQNNDPDKAGKIKIFVPHISSTVYNNWVRDGKNKTLKFIGNNINEDLTEILDDLKKITPWADCAAPLVGESSSGRFNNFNLTGSVSDSNFFDTITSATSALTGEGAAPSNFYDETTRVTDAFTNASDNINRPNPLSYEYKPNGYSNEAKGAFCIPSVGAHVWVFFREGNPNFPVYFAASFGQSDWQGIYESQNEPGLDYPSTYENKNASITEYNNNVEAYRNKYVINQKGGTLEFVNSDLNEKVRMTHYSGSFKEMNNQSTIELNTKNKQGLTLNDSYDTIRGFKNEYTGKNLDEIVYRDKYKKVGSLNEEYFKKWKDLVAGIQEFKQLFEIKRTGDNSVKDSNGITILKRNSLLQERSGTFADYPVTNTDTYQARSGVTDTPDTVGVKSASNENPANGAEKTSSGAVTASSARWPGQSGKTFVNGTGKSLSTQDGTWDVDDRKDKLKELIEASLPELTEIEKELGIGGSEIIQITKHKMETIGMLMNDFGSIRVDNIGKLTPSEVLVDNDVVYLNKTESPLMEYVHVQDLPGGNSTLNVSNRYNVMVGAGGLNLKSYGPTNLTGTITNVAGEQVNVASENEINIDAKVVNISGEILRLRNKNQRQVLIDSGLGVNKNVIIGGGLHVEGELFVQHITAPVEFQITEHCDITTFSTEVATEPVGHTGHTHQVNVPEHAHYFRAPAMTLVGGNAALRAAAATALNDSSSRSVAEAIHNEKKV
jgi:hypothetical protein